MAVLFYKISVNSCGVSKEEIILITNNVCSATNAVYAETSVCEYILSSVIFQCVSYYISKFTVQIFDSRELAKLC